MLDGSRIERRRARAAALRVRRRWRRVRRGGVRPRGAAVFWQSPESFGDMVARARGSRA